MAKYILSAFADEYSSDVKEQAEILKAHGINYIEIRACYEKNISVLSMDELKEIKAIYDDYGIKVNSIGSPIGKVKTDVDMSEYLLLCKSIFEKANYLGAKNVRVFSFYPTGDKFTEDEIKIVYDKLGQKSSCGNGSG